MAENKLNEAAQTLAKSLRKSNETVVNSTLAAQERNFQFAQSVLEQSMEVAKQQSEQATTISQALAASANDPRSAWQTWLDGAVAAQERTIHYTQNVLEQGIATLRAHSESAQALAQELIAQGQQQQDAYRVLAQEAFAASLNSVFAATRTR